MKRNQTGLEIIIPMTWIPCSREFQKKYLSFIIVRKIHRKIKIYFEYFYVLFFLQLFLKSKTQEDHNYNLFLYCFGFLPKRPIFRWTKICFVYCWLHNISINSLEEFQSKLGTLVIAGKETGFLYINCQWVSI